MIMYRPHRGSLADAMADAREFENEHEMKEYIWSVWNELPETFSAGDQAFSLDDIVIGEVLGDDERIGWKNVRHVCVRRMYDEDYMKLYGSPQCIGWCGE